MLGVSLAFSLSKFFMKSNIDKESFSMPLLCVMKRPFFVPLFVFIKYFKHKVICFWQFLSNFWNNFHIFKTKFFMTFNFREFKKKWAKSTLEKAYKNNGFIFGRFWSLKRASKISQFSNSKISKNHFRLNKF